MAAPPPGGSFIGRLRERGLLLIAIGLVVAGILVHGYLQRGPRIDPAEEPADSVPPAPAATPFRPYLEKVPLSYFSDYWLQLGEHAHDLLVTFGEARLTGVRIGQAYALGSVEAADMIRAAPGDTPEVQLVALDGRRHLALFRLTANVDALPRPLAGSLHAGAWVAALTLDPQGSLDIAPGHLVSAPGDAQWLDVAIPFPPSFDVGAVVDLDSQLVGVAIRGSGGMRVLSADAAREVIDELVSRPPCRAVDVAPIPDPVRDALHLSEGVVVAAVVPGAFASSPDILPGDVLVQLAGEHLASPEDFAQAWDSQEPGTQVRFLVSRGSRRLVRQAEMPGRDCRPDGSTPRVLPRLGAVVQWASTAEGGGFRVLHVSPESPASLVGIETGDVVVAVDGSPLAWPEARSLLAPQWSRRRVPVLTVRRDDAVRLVAPPVGQEG